MSPSRAVRVARGSTAAGIATFIALVSHITGGGQMPGWIGIALPAVLSVAVCTLLAGRRMSLWRLSVAVLASQALFHTLFVLGTFSPSPASSATLSHHVHGAAQMAIEPGMTSMHGHAGAAMWMMHGIAAVLTTVALYRGEKACLRLREIAVELVRWARRRLLRVLLAFVAAPARDVRAIFTEPSRPVVSRLVFSLTRRGPPTVAVF
ncbi:hypothetical protein M3667_00130 [Microbacterium sp. P26]|uniref:hypothetical protein n=1 Tax=Microbacterium TaxID=33882 RepID=UPI00203CA464|nr:hypothetical protein [Microbacterium sp. P26]MCM3500279.1 hypothetical protein [Microbacterium sp. P26]